MLCFLFRAVSIEVAVLGSTMVAGQAHQSLFLKA